MCSRNYKHISIENICSLNLSSQDSELSEAEEETDRQQRRRSPGHSQAMDANTWRGLLEPLDRDLRRCIIHYGSTAQTTYDALNSELSSKHAGCCMYSKKDIFSKVGIDEGNPYKYRVTKYIYGTSSAPLPLAFLVQSLSREARGRESNWMGYVAVATDEGKSALGRRDILIAWRGTARGFEWVDDLEFGLASGSDIFGGMMVLRCILVGIQSTLLMIPNQSSTTPVLDTRYRALSMLIPRISKLAV